MVFLLSKGALPVEEGSAGITLFEVGNAGTLSSGRPFQGRKPEVQNLQLFAQPVLRGREDVVLLGLVETRNELSSNGQLGLYVANRSGAPTREATRGGLEMQH